MRYSLFFVLLLFSSILQGQSIIQFEKDTISQSISNVNLENQFHEYRLDVDFMNNTNDFLQVYWKREFADYCPVEWDVYTADPNISYVPTIDESPLPFPMLPGEKDLNIAQFFNPNEVRGCCDIQMIFFLEESPDVPIDTIYFHININDEDCNLTNIWERTVETANLYPNPSMNYVYIENSSVLKSIQIIDLKGQVYFENSMLVPNRINVSTFPQGMYICKVKSKTGNTLISKLFKY